jgi:glycerol kinase
MQSQADLLGRQVDVSAVAEVSALGVAKLAWQVLGHPAAWTAGADVAYVGTLGDIDRAERRARWAGEIARARFIPPER